MLEINGKKMRGTHEEMIEYLKSKGLFFVDSESFITDLSKKKVGRLGKNGKYRWGKMPKFKRI